jgi:hypothetical protein
MMVWAIEGAEIEECAKGNLSRLILLRFLKATLRLLDNPINVASIGKTIR